MQWIAALAALAHIFAWSAPAMAQPVSGHRTVITQSWVEEWDPAAQSWVRVEGAADGARARVESAPMERGASSNSKAHGVSYGGIATHARRPLAPRGAGQYGPFLVLDDSRAAIVGSTDTASPRHFDAMMRDFPGLATLEMIEAPGTSNDIANLEVGRKIRAHGLATHVPRGGSVRSGAVELFLAGATRTIEPGALFAVHSWLDNYGREPDDFAPDAPANRLYLDYYREMGMSEARARAFYAMTNSVPHHSAKWLRADEMRGWIAPDVRQQTPILAYRDVSLFTIAGFGAGFGSMFDQPFLDS